MTLSIMTDDYWVLVVSNLKVGEALADGTGDGDDVSGACLNDHFMT